VHLADLLQVGLVAGLAIEVQSPVGDVQRVAQVVADDGRELL
jgi:hypothetical protein